MKDGIITKIETDDENEPAYRACLRGRAYRQRVYAPDRLKFPLRRIGERGEGRFEQISWDEALDTVAGEIKRVRDTYGALSILLITSLGDGNHLHGDLAINRMLTLSGGHSNTWGFWSFEQTIFAELATFGTFFCRNSPDDLLNSRLIVMWGCDPAVTVNDSRTTFLLKQAKEQGVRIVSVNPRYTRSAAILADKWIPISPGTDTAMLIAMAYVMITENLQDQRYLATYTVGFDRYRDYILGREDSIPKNPAWAEAITGVPAATIEALAREYATTKPAAIGAAASYMPGSEIYAALASGVMDGAH